MNASRPFPKVALVSVGLGRVRRGYERYFDGLFRVLGGQLPITLFKSAGERNERERVPPLLGPATAIARRLPLGRLAGSAEYNRDCLAFALTMLPPLLREDFDLIHCIDPPLPFALRYVKRLARLRAPLLLTEGCLMPPALYPRVDHIHHVAGAAYQTAIDYGIPPSTMTLIPCGLHSAQFPALEDTAALRQRYGIADSTFVVLAISAIRRIHKRIDYVVKEVNRIEGDVLLWIDGNPEDEPLARLAREMLGARLRITHVPSSEVPALYRTADVMVHAALEESFGLAIVEALCSGTPVLAHDSPHFEWLMGGREGLVDMAGDGNLAARLRELAARRQGRYTGMRARSELACRRFDWKVVSPAYLELYRKVAAGSSGPSRTLV